MTESVEFYVCRPSTGEILRTGVCNPSQLSQQAHESGSVAREGRATPEDRVAGNGAVQAPVDVIPHTRSSVTTVTGLPNPTTVKFNGQNSLYRVRNGTWTNFLDRTAVFEFSSPGYRSVSVELLGENISINEDIF